MHPGREAGLRRVRPRLRGKTADHQRQGEREPAARRGQQ